MLCEVENLCLDIICSFLSLLIMIRGEQRLITKIVLLQHCASLTGIDFNVV